jgi:NADPH-dependent glutamate synthase beta subunit-like oxidoreductase
MDAIRFLRETKDGTRTAVPANVAVLAGDDCAMDAAVTAKALGAENVYIVFGGPRSAMHWHKAEEWFKTDGVHGLPLTQPLGYETDDQGRVTGLRVARTLPAGGNHTPNAQRLNGAAHREGGSRLLGGGGSETILPIDLVIEALSLEPEDGLPCPETDNIFRAGGMLNGGATVAQCIAEGMRAAGSIHEVLSANRG